MKGIQCAFTGKLGQEAELKTSKAGKPWLSLHVAVDGASEEATTWIRLAVFGQLATDLHPDLKKATEVYVEGRLRLEVWTGRDGRERTGLSVAAAKVEVLGRIGFDSQSRRPEEPRGAHPELEGHGRSEREDLPF
jgi:single-strand DNA-binding protein